MKGKKIAMALIMALLFLMPIPVKAVETDSFKIKMLPSTLELHRKENLEISLLIDLILYSISLQQINISQHLNCFDLFNRL